ncbi:MAG TPA: glycosyltransferase, partial [Puia sp.]|nr:glycosyltransferase [Puia sp.]
KYRADLIMTTAGIAAASGRIPQCIWMPPRPFPLLSTLQREAVLFCFSEKDRSKLPTPEKTVVVSGAADPSVVPLAEAEKTHVKADWAEGKEYFLALITAAPLPDVVNLLKAFSLFKKRQQSNMHLVLLGAPSEKDGQLANRLSSYKYRPEVHFHAHLSDNDRLQLTGASYATLFLHGDVAPGLMLLNTLKAEVPVMTPPGSLLSEIAGDATLEAAPDDPTALAGQLMRIYKDETFRSSLIAKGRERLLLSDSSRPIDAIWNGIRLALGS